MDHLRLLWAPLPPLSGAMTTSLFTNAGINVPALLSALPPGMDVRVFAEPDDFSCGPLLPIRDLAEWRAGRLAYWRSVVGNIRETAATWAASDLHGVSRVLVIAGMSLADQLFLAWIFAVAESLDFEVARIEVVQLRRNERGHCITSPALITPAAIAASFSQARCLSTIELRYLATAWEVATAPDPASLLRFLDDSTPPLPILRDGFARLLWRYPSATTGVNGAEELLLANTRTYGPSVPRIIGETLAGAFDEEESVGDGWLFGRLRRLANVDFPYPAVALSGTTTEMRGTEAFLTEHGRNLLAGRFNFARQNRIDDWVGGVHLHSHAGAVWFRTEKTLIRD